MPSFERRSVVHAQEISHQQLSKSDIITRASEEKFNKYTCRQSNNLSLPRNLPHNQHAKADNTSSMSSDTIFMVAHAPPTSTPTFRPEPSQLYSQDEALGNFPEWIIALAGIGTVAALWLILVVIGWLMGLCRVRDPAQPPINRRPNLPNVPAVFAQANRRAIRRSSPPANPSVNPAINIDVAFPTPGAYGPTTLNFIFNRPFV